jgi:cbb3-type cytochrome oxidase maturation protein
MTIIVLLIAISLTIAVLFLGVFIWSLKSGQFDDTYTPNVRMLFEDEVKGDEKTKKAK